MRKLAKTVFTGGFWFLIIQRDASKQSFKYALNF